MAVILTKWPKGGVPQYTFFWEMDLLLLLFYSQTKKKMHNTLILLNRAELLEAWLALTIG